MNSLSVEKLVRSKILRESRFVLPTPPGSKLNLDFGGVDCACCVRVDCGGGESGDSPPPQSPRTQHTRSTPPRSRFDFDPEGVGRTKRDSLRILLLTDFTAEREVKTQYRRLARVYHPDKYDQTSTQMTSRQSEEHFKLINNAYEYLRNILWPQSPRT